MTDFSDEKKNSQKRKNALYERCSQHRSALAKRDPREIASCAALSLECSDAGNARFNGIFFNNPYQISWPDLLVTDQNGEKASLEIELYWLHYLDRADGHPLSGQWVNLSQIGGLFYQQAFQGYSGDLIAAAWGENRKGLAKKCRDNGGWELPGPGDLAFQWHILPRFPLCLCYRLPTTGTPARASLLFDSNANHYLAADAAATAGKYLTDRLLPT